MFPSVYGSYGRFTFPKRQGWPDIYPIKKNGEIALLPAHIGTHKIDTEYDFSDIDLGFGIIHHLDFDEGIMQERSFQVKVKITGIDRNRR